MVCEDVAGQHGDAAAGGADAVGAIITTWNRRWWSDAGSFGDGDTRRGRHLAWEGFIRRASAAATRWRRSRPGVDLEKAVKASASTPAWAK